jgi:hypothetical protein
MTKTVRGKQMTKPVGVTEYNLAMEVINLKGKYIYKETMNNM